jgi:hypothetical protein
VVSYGTSICDGTEEEAGGACHGQGHADRPASCARNACARRSLVVLGLGIAQRAGVRTKKAAQAAEMASHEIDLLGDPSASDEERQVRKRRLIKGPKEFLDLRRNRPKANG